MAATIVCFRFNTSGVYRKGDGATSSPLTLPSYHLQGLGERVVEVVAEFLLAQPINESRLKHDLHRLRLHRGEENLHPIPAQFLHGNAEGMQTTGIHRRHIAHAENDN